MAGKGFCTRHQHDIANRLKFLGLWKFVKAQDTELGKDIARAWMAGQLRREMICPLIVLMLELQAKANKIADKLGGTKGALVQTCPCCAIQRMTDDETQDVKQIVGFGDLVLALMQSNGLVGGDPSPALKPKVRAAPRGLRLV